MLRYNCYALMLLFLSVAIFNSALCQPRTLNSTSVNLDRSLTESCAETFDPPLSGGVLIEVVDPRTGVVDPPLVDTHTGRCYLECKPCSSERCHEQHSSAMKLFRGRSQILNRKIRADGALNTAGTANGSDANDVPPVGVVISGLRVEQAPKPPVIDLDSVVSVIQNQPFTLRVFGRGLNSNVRIKFVTSRLLVGENCHQSHSTSAYEPMEVDPYGYWSVLKVTLPPLHGDDTGFYLCALSDNGPAGVFVFQGSEHYLSLRSFPPLLPVALHVLLLVLLLFLSGLFSGLNLGLMALTLTELKIVLKTGADSEKRWARVIIPVRNHGNYLLCTLLLGNVLVNSSLTILLDDLTSGIVAIIGSTLGIVIFGEIVPQALCSRHGLAVGAHTIYLTKLFMLITAPLSFPISLILDKVLGEEIGNTYNRDRLKELIKLNKDDMGLENEEQNIIYGALDLKAKCVSEIMTKLDDVYMLPIEAILDYDTISEIMAQGYSRIPVFENERANIVSVMFAKDLAFVDPDDCTPIKTLCQFYQNPWSFVFEDVTLDSMLREFKTGSKGHMAFVQRVITDTDADPYYEVIGLVTLEDVIEEMIQAEIVDETDILTDNRTKKRRGRKRQMPDPTAFSQPSKSTVVISPQMSLAAFQFLQTLAAFSSESLAPSVLKRMLEQDVVRQIKIRSDGAAGDSSPPIYELGKVADFFCLILEGRVQATIGKEGLSFDSGPFSYYGVQALASSDPESGSGAAVVPTTAPRGSVLSLESVIARGAFIAEYTVRAVTDVCFLKIRRAHYLAARRATLISQRSGSSAVDDLLIREMDSAAGTTTALSESSDQQRRDSSTVHSGNGTDITDPLVSYSNNNNNNSANNHSESAPFISRNA